MDLYGQTGTNFTSKSTGGRIMNTNEMLCVGIDLGTTNTVLAITNKKLNGEVTSKVIELPRAVESYSSIGSNLRLSMDKDKTLPSCVYYSMENNMQPIVGDFAKHQYSLRPHLVAKSIKSQMGKPLAEGLSPDVPDKTPAQISSRILEHVIRSGSKICGQKITNAVITVPANFDSAMCKATLEAAKLAGIEVENSDGSEKPVLLSEPNAVIYDLVNEINNGEFPSGLLDLSKKNLILVFDLGGGTLDITIHEVQRRADAPDVLKVDEIATNRYTRLGGDDFDEVLAEVMYQHYLKQNKNNTDVIAKIKSNKDVHMAELRDYARILKEAIGSKDDLNYCSGWEDEESFLVGGKMSGGISYGDSFTKEDVEAIFQPLMARNLKYDDYKRLSSISDTRNIIYPILDVLKKASDKLGQANVTIDAVVLNGGMSKFYMVQDRLKEFFGRDPIVALDPDQSVAKGAAIYHYLLQSHEEMKDDMRMVPEGTSVYQEESSAHKVGIEWGNAILNDGLYLGIRNGAVYPIIPTGAVLPYTSKVMTGFKIEPGQNRIAVPIKSQNLDGSYRTIASGNIAFRKRYFNGAYVSFQIQMSNSKIISMTAWTSKDLDGQEKLEEGTVEIQIDNAEHSSVKCKMQAPSGSMLQAKDEIDRLRQLCVNMDKGKYNADARVSAAKRVKEAVKNIISASNKADFAEPVLKELEASHSDEEKIRLYIIARKMGAEWSENDRKKLAKICMEQLRPAFYGAEISGTQISVNDQAIYALSICGKEADLSRLSELHLGTKYHQACIYTHARTCTATDWLLSEFKQDIKLVCQGRRNNLQFSSYAIGQVLNPEASTFSIPKAQKALELLCTAMESGHLTAETLVCCVLAAGWICDQRGFKSDMNAAKINRVLSAIRNIEITYALPIAEKSRKAQQIAEKLILGECLEKEEEQYLLSKVDPDED